MKFTELTVNTTSAAQELVADVMWNYTNYGVAISDVKDVVELISDRRETWDYIDDKLLENLNGNAALVKAYIPTDVEGEILPKIYADLGKLKENGAGETDFGSLETVRRTVDGDDWIEIWKKHFRPIELGKIVVCPAWINYEPKEGRKKVIIDSNTAFGTGEHETTSMVVRLMQKYVGKAETVLDVGTGSGILGISAALLGAKKVVMTDIDYVAVKSAIHNAEMNGVSDRCEVFLNDLLKEKDVKGDLVLANITADVLIKLAETIPEHVNAGGTIILSGIIKKKVDEVISVYSEKGFTLSERENEGEWIALAMKKV